MTFEFELGYCQICTLSVKKKKCVLRDIVTYGGWATNFGGLDSASRDIYEGLGRQFKLLWH